MAAHHIHQLRVRYAETDAQQVAHHSAYVVWLEEARIEALRSLGRSYRDLEASGVLMPVTGLSIRYLRPLRFDDLVSLVTGVRVEGRTRLRFDTAIRHGQTLCAEATVTVVTVNPVGRPIRLPEDLVALLQLAPAPGPGG